MHLLALGFFQRYSLWFSSTEDADPNSDWLSLVDKKERDEILKIAFQPTKEEQPELVELKPEVQNEPQIHIKTPSLFEEPKNNTMLFQSSLAFSINEPLIHQSLLPAFTIPTQSSVNLLDHLPKDLIVPVTKERQRSMFLPFPTESNVTLNAKAPAVEKEAQTEQMAYSDLLDRSLTESPQVGKAPQMIPIPELPKLPTLSELQTASYSDSFDADLVFLPKGDGKGYIFALTLIPKPDLNLPRFRQHITFLVDRSNSIQQGRLNATKAALHKGLEYLSEEDTFNIIAFDSKTEKMSPNSLPSIGRSLAVAEEFLERIQLGSFFSSSDLLRPLFLSVPGEVPNDEIHTAILITDGETLSKDETVRSLLYDWTYYNNGKVTLYALGMNDPHTPALETITAFNRGKVVSSNSQRGLKRKLPKLLKAIQNPIAKNLYCSAISRSPQSKITLYPNSFKMPNLYLNQPYVILGETDSLDDFILFVQGRLKGKWLNIRKTVSFLNARKASKTLQQEIALQKAYDLYERYAMDPNPKHVAEAQSILEPFNYPTTIR